ncbi:hypothetical protein PsYK624_075840 [Phanerochaete sordida]|uniref:GST C-terminal domain-containing protein n=1 Tax=Phanerochaete sordida TaxID=48140 RepID=A0A9P3LEB2_9APHY|nr:hypothetical protein PsYK624_075840 [Phanerochaete sordida]
MTSSLKVSTNAYPYAAAAVACLTGKATLEFTNDRHQPLLEQPDGTSLTGEVDIISALSAAGGIAAGSTKSPYFIGLAQSLRGPNSYSSISRTFDIIDNHLGYRTWLDGHDMSTADWVLWGSLKGSPMSVGLLKLGRHRHLLRWYTHIESLDATQAALRALADARAHEAEQRSRTPTPYSPLSPLSPFSPAVADADRAPAERVAPSSAVADKVVAGRAVADRAPPRPPVQPMGGEKSVLSNPFFAPGTTA